ncbi:glycosyltransferase involved in cell wall biosynthesis [Okibacterium sp. HSC-33S16]|uniref:glycosyltransferase n=1 Tax=Okibacterium sp. HSC-33S16 TaxID=2910965 RepID=UPI0020A0E412|nr:glycosyltransferase [Okibacterium sp. HSC-33S16]MCP2031551.1 glycosyltransferase involved in cell wall biosynthesis [Okibacterium sp. HSC-33S16]
MKVVVYPHDLALGGSQLNAIELAGAVQSTGNSAVIVGRPGALVSRIRDLGLEFIEVPPPGRRPSPSIARFLARLVDDRGIDVIHGYEWPPTLEAVMASKLNPAVSVVSTVMSMAVAPFIPKTVPLIVGTEQIRAAEIGFGRSSVDTLEPPVDLTFNAPGLELNREGFKAKWGIDDHRHTVVAVSRLAHELKLEGLLSAMDGIAFVNETIPVRLVIVGDGPARAVVRDRAHSINSQHGAGTIVLVGELDDPRVAYDIADVTLGMGGSALRALAFNKPLIVQGEQGFWKLLTPESLAGFLWTGWYGTGVAVDQGARALANILSPLLLDAELRNRLGAFGRQTVEQRFSLEQASIRQLDIYRAAMASKIDPTTATFHEAAAGVRYASYYAAKRFRRAMGRERTDDFNARPVTQTRMSGVSK